MMAACRRVGKCPAVAADVRCCC